jgi:glutaredoxin 3
MVFSWSGCPFCKNAKALLSDMGAKYTALELDTMGAEGKAIRAELAQVSGAGFIKHLKYIEN